MNLWNINRAHLWMPERSRMFWKGTCSSVVIRKGSTKPELGQTGRMRAVTAASAQRIHRDCYTVGTQQRASGQQMLHITITKAEGHEARNRFLVKLLIFITTICPLKPRGEPRIFNNLKSIIMAWIEPDTTCTFQVHMQLPGPCHNDRPQKGHKARSGVKNKGLRQLWPRCLRLKLWHRCLSHLGQFTHAWIMMYIYWRALGQGFTLIPLRNLCTQKQLSDWIEVIHNPSIEALVTSVVAAIHGLHSRCTAKLLRRF